MSKIKQLHNKPTYVWTKIGEGTGMPLKIGVNQHKGIRIVGDYGAVEIPTHYAAAHMILEMMANKETDHLHNETAFMLQIVQSFSDETLRNILFSFLDLQYYLTVNQLAFKELKQEPVDQDKDPDKWSEQELEKVKYYNELRAEALKPMTGLLKAMQRIKNKREKDIKNESGV